MGRIEMIINTEECPICKKNMVIEAKRGIFPYGMSIDQKTQMEKLKLAFQSNIKVDDEYVCVECGKAGKAKFLCALCDERKSSNKEERSFGDPEEFLCTDCYETVTAKVWNEKVKLLHAQHRWDFE